MTSEGRHHHHHRCVRIKTKLPQTACLHGAQAAAAAVCVSVCLLRKKLDRGGHVTLVPMLHYRPL